PFSSSHRAPHSFPTRRSSDLAGTVIVGRVLDRYPWGATVLPLGLITVGLLGLYALGQVQVVTVALIAVIGMAFSGLAVAVQSRTDRKSTRLNSSHVAISYAVF